MNSRLVERGGDRAGKVYLLTKEVTTIGRDPDNDIAVVSAHLSRQHAQVRWTGTAYLLEDLDSKNGTFLNGARLRARVPQRLQHGDLIVLPTDPEIHLEVDFGVATVTRPARDGAVSAKLSGLRIDTRTTEVWAGEQRLVLTAKEYLALAALAAKAGALMTKDELATAVWPELEGVVGEANIEQLLYRVRQKLTAVGLRDALVTVRGLGYRLQHDSDAGTTGA